MTVITFGTTKSTLVMPSLARPMLAQSGQTMVGLAFVMLITT